MARFHPVADNLVLVADHSHIRLFDISTQKQVYSEEKSCSTVSWSYHGSLACSTNKDGKVRIPSILVLWLRLCLRYDVCLTCSK